MASQLLCLPSCSCVHSCDACLIPDALVRTFVTHLENIGSWLYNGDAQNSKKSFHVAFMGQKDGAGPELESSGTAPFVYLKICTIVYIFNLNRLQSVFFISIDYSLLKSILQSVFFLISPPIVEIFDSSRNEMSNKRVRDLPDQLQMCTYLRYLPCTRCTYSTFRCAFEYEAELYFSSFVRGNMRLGYISRIASEML